MYIHVCIRVCVHSHLSGCCACRFVCVMWVCVHTCVECACVRTCTYMCAHVCTSVSCSHVFVRVYICVCTCVLPHELSMHVCAYLCVGGVTKMGNWEDKTSLSYLSDPRGWSVSLSTKCRYLEEPVSGPIDAMFPNRSSPYAEASQLSQCFQGK